MVKTIVMCLCNEIFIAVRSIAKCEYLTVASSIDTVLQSSGFVCLMLVYGQTNAVSINVDIEESDYLDIIQSLFWSQTSLIVNINPLFLQS